VKYIYKATSTKPKSVCIHRELLILSDGGEVALDWADPLEEQGNVPHVLLILPGLTGNLHLGARSVKSVISNMTSARSH